MTSPKSYEKPRGLSCRPLLVTLLVVGSTLQILGPVLAQVAAGTAIRNTATATYEDPAAPGV
jgi:hypothetical protein